MTMDRSIEYQQRLAELPFGVVLIRAISNRMADLRLLVPEILAALTSLRPGELRRVGT